MLQRRRISNVSSRPVLATLLATSLVVSATFGLSNTDILKTQAEDLTPVAAAVNTESFDAGQSVLVDDPAIASQGEGEGPRAVKEFSRDTEFSMFALTWQGQQDIAAYFRAQHADGSWGPWYSAEPTSETKAEGKNGTELVYIEPTKKVQVSLSGVELGAPDAEMKPAEKPTSEASAAESAKPTSTEAPAEAPAAPAAAPAEAKPAEAKPATTGRSGLAPLPTNFGDIKPVADVKSLGDLQAVFVDGKAADGGIAMIAETSDATGMPKIISRKGWRADESIRTNCQASPEYTDPTEAIVIHHTAGSNNYSEAQSAEIVRGIYQYHAQTLGWCDVGYNTLVDKYGNIFEGRFGGVNRGVWGAHAGGFNENTWAISMMGDYSSVAPSQATIKSVGELAGWRAKVAGFDPTGTQTHESEGTSYSKYAYGTNVTLPRIFAHRDVGTTSCPGDAGYAQMGNIRKIAKSKYDGLVNGTDKGTETDDKPKETVTTPATTTATSTPTTTPVPTTAAATNTSEKTTEKTTAGATTTTAETVAQDPTTTTKPASTDNVVVADTEEKPAQQASLGQVTSNLQALIDGLRDTNPQAALGAVGSLAGLALAYMATQGTLPNNVTVDDGVPLIDGLNLKSIPAILGGIAAAAQFTQNNDTATVISKVAELAAPMLGEARGEVVNTTSSRGGEAVAIKAFENGAVVSSESTGTNAIWGAIADAWAKQGFDSGVLGLPVNQEYAWNNGVRVDFQGGYITYDPTTNQATIHPK